MQCASMHPHPGCCRIINLTPIMPRRWGIPTATDISLAWLVAVAVFGKGHPAVAFLLLLAVADDGVRA